MGRSTAASHFSTSSFDALSPCICCAATLQLAWSLSSPTFRFRSERGGYLYDVRGSSPCFGPGTDRFDSALSEATPLKHAPHNPQIEQNPARESGAPSSPPPPFSSSPCNPSTRPRFGPRERSPLKQGSSLLPGGLDGQLKRRRHTLGLDHTVPRFPRVHVNPPCL